MFMRCVQHAMSVVVALKVALLCYVCHGDM